MRILTIKHYAFVLITALLFQSLRAQQITAKEKSDAIQNIAGHIAANYVYAEKGGQIASHIQNANFKGEFDKATTWQEFDEQVTSELKSFSNDGHLYVRYDPEVVKELRKNAGKQEMKSKVFVGGASETDVVTEVKVLEGNVGYVKMKEINITKKNVDQLYGAMRKMEGTKALIVDLRDNGGGGSEVGPLLESYFLPAGTPTLTFTTRDGNYTTDSTVNWLTEKAYDKPVYILVNKKTASAAEAFAFVLQQNRRAKVVGERTAGAAYMNSWYAVNDDNYVSVSTAVPSLPGKNISWEINGIQPDIKVKKGDPLQIALQQIR
jgi:hypothetical protein